MGWWIICSQTTSGFLKTNEHLRLDLALWVGVDKSDSDKYLLKWDREEIVIEDKNSLFKTFNSALKYDDVGEITTSTLRVERTWTSLS